MSYHILHLINHGTALNKYRGQLRVRYANKTEQSLPLEDIKAIICASRGISFTNDLIARLLELNVVILHCNTKYHPVGWTLPQERIVHPELIEFQATLKHPLKNSLWRLIVQQKILNQATVLDHLQSRGDWIRRHTLRKKPDEALAAREYFKLYFAINGEPNEKRSNRTTGTINPLLNYGYAMISSLLLRFIYIHGLHPTLGLSHVSRYKTLPLLYDLIEPWRPLVDWHLTQYLGLCKALNQPTSIENWAKYVAEQWVEQRYNIRGKNIKLVDAIMVYIRKFCTAVIRQRPNDLWLPSMDTFLSGEKAH